MVYKVCKGGVRSGNTLRGLHTLRTKRYASQACAVGESSLSRQQINCLLEDGTDDAAVTDALKNTGVLLSLNKRGRWTLPAKINHMIRAGRFSDNKAIVSVLERHKLKRRANCVGFACNKSMNGSVRGVQGKGRGVINDSESQQSQKKYFSFNLDCMDQEESRRQWKKRRAEEMKRLTSGDNLKGGKGSQQNMRTVKAMTTEGRGSTNTGTRLQSTKPEYRLEVFYPCPQSCSLTFNPKYTDVIMTRNDDGEMEVRANVKAEKKSKRKQRKRFTAGDLTAFSAEALYYENDVDEMWAEDYETNSFAGGLSDKEDEYSTSTTERMQALLTEDTRGGDENRSRDGAGGRLSESILACLVEQAERAKAHCSGINARTRHRRSSGRQWENTDIPKSHIIYTDRETEHSRMTNYKPVRVPAPRQDPAMSSTPVILSADEVSPASLRTKFGNLYAEASCQPRRFCIDITHDVNSLLSVPRSIRRSEVYTTYIMFTSAGFYDEGLETYNVMANCAACVKPEHVSYAIPYGLSTIDSVINRFVGNLLDLKEAESLLFSGDTRSVITHVDAPFHEMLMEKMKIQVDTFFTSDEFNRMCQGGSLQDRGTDKGDDFCQSLMQLAADCDVDIFCEICYESVNMTQINAVAGTQLTTCGHVFCDDCWRQHLRTRLREGSVHMSCPGYQCDEKLGLVTLLSLLHVTEVTQICRKACEDEVETCPTAKWCPNTDCGRVIRLSTRSSKAVRDPADDGESIALDNDLCLDVTCACGNSWCFNCLSQAHWPARCEQAQDYLDKVTTLKPVLDTRNDLEESMPVISASPTRRCEAVEVEGRLCPKCHRFVEKNGGCPHMSCKCGHQYCWKCMEPYIGHSICIPNAKTLYRYSRRVKVYHMGSPTAFDLGDGAQGPTQTIESESSSMKASSRPRQKASMYQRALEHRIEAGRANGLTKSVKALATKICDAAGKDLKFKREVLLQCGVQRSDIPESTSDLVRIPVAHDVIRYLRSCQQARQSLLRVAEFTHVLLQGSPCSSLEKRRALRVASDLSAYCSFSLSVLQAGGNQEARTAMRRLADIQVWMDRTLDALLATVARLHG